MGADKIIARSISAMGMRPCTTNSAGEITGVGTAIILDNVRGQKFAMGILEGGSTGGSTDEKIEVLAGGGVGIYIPKLNLKIDTDGNTLTESEVSGGGGGGGGDVLGVRANQVEKADMLVIHEHAGDPWVFWIRVGANVATAEDMDIYLLGKPSTLPELSPDPETPVQWNFDITGGKSYKKASGVLDSALAWDPGTVTPVGPVGEVDDIDPTPLAEAEIAAATYATSGAPKGLLSGRAVIY